MRDKISFRLFAILAAWAAVALVFAGQSYFYGLVTGENKDWWRVFWWTFVDWYLWALLSPAIFWLARHYNFEAGSWAKSLSIHTIAAVIFSLAHLVLQSFIQTLTKWSKFDGNDLFLTTFVFLFFKKIHLNLLTYAALIGINHAARLYRSNQARIAEAHRLAAEKHQLAADLAHAQLTALQMQLNPHFLFNALNTLSEMIHQNPKSADKMVARLGDLLRMSLEREYAAEVPLDKELEFLRKYLEIEQLRFHDRLTVSFDVSPETLKACVPSLILQPLAENAVKHGVAAIPGEGRIEIVTERSDNKLKLIIRDNGAGLPENWQTSIGERERIGLSNTRARLRQLYDGNSRFEIRGAAAGGTEVLIEIPFKEHCNGKHND
ncbi:MAG: histidine kinase [Acidobacteriota bacterium]|nr:histidine kinase [Acidobacteriota bacterium]